MSSVMDLLVSHAAICVECLVRSTHSRADVVYRELERLDARPKEGHCASCTAVLPVFSIG